MRKIRLFLDMLLHPIFVLIYGLAWYELSELCQYGGKSRHIPILIGCGVFFLLYLILYVAFVIVKPSALKRYHKESEPTARNIWIKCYYVVAVVLLLTSTAFYGSKVVHSEQNFNGKLSWFFHDLDTRRYVELKKNNFYEDGTITYLDTFLYGKDGAGKLQSYLIDYNIKSNETDMVVYEKGTTNPSYAEEKELQPLLDTVKAINKKELEDTFAGHSIGILYFGVRSFGYNTDKIVYVDANGNKKSPTVAKSELKEAFVSIYDPANEQGPLTKRYALIDDINQIPADQEETSKEKENADETTGESCYVSKKIGYCLQVVDAALGSRFYALSKTDDGGETWNVVNEDPYLGEGGTSAGITFLGEKTGFIGLSHVSGDSAKLYRTEDGGKSFHLITLPEVTGDRKNGDFDYPSVPVKEGNKLILKVGKGSDGDDGLQALFESEDNGKSFLFKQIKQ